MNVKEQINEFIFSQPESKQIDIKQLNDLILTIAPQSKLWFTDGRNSEGKIVSNPDIGYGSYTITYAKGDKREFYPIGISPNKTGISFYILGLEDKKFLAETYGDRIGKADVTGYCIRFKKLKDINIDVLEEAIRYRFENN